MTQTDKKIFWLSTAIEKYAESLNKNRVQAFNEMDSCGAFDFLEKHYNVEHLLSFEDVLDDINSFTKKENHETLSRH